MKNTRKIYWQKLRHGEIGEAVKEDAIVILPVGSMEQHGPALPVGTDTIDVERVARLAAERLENKIRILIFPALWMGDSLHHIDYPGTVSLPPELLIEIVFNIVKEVLRNGFKRLLLLNGHGGNEAYLSVTITKIMRELKVIVPWLTHWNLIFPEKKLEDILESRPAYGDHPGEYEASLSWAVSPDSVDTSLFGKAPLLSLAPKTKFLKQGRVAIFGSMKLRTKEGFSGDCTLASKEKGEELLDLTVSEFVRFLEEFKKWDLENIGSLYTK